MAITPNDSLTTISFKSLSVLNDSLTTKEKRPIYDDMEVCEIKFAANKQTVGVFPAHESLGWVDGPDGSRHEQTYAMKYNTQYLAFKNGEGQAQNGTPLELATFLTPSKRLELKALNIWTVEALASLDGAPLKRLGMGGRDLQKQAAMYLAEQPAQETSALVEVVSRQDDQIAILMQQIKDMQAQLAGKTLADNAPAVEPEPAPKGKPGRKPKAADAKPSPFAEFENVDILNWLKDTDASDEFAANWPINEEGAMVNEMSDDDRDALVAHADEVNAKIAASKKAN